METRIRKLDYSRIDENIIQEAGQIIRRAVLWPFPQRQSTGWAATP